MHNAFSELSRKSFPSVAEHIVLIVQATVEDKGKEIKFGVHVEDPSGRPLAEMEQGVGSNVQNNVAPGSGELDGIAHAGFFVFDGLPLPEAGKYHFEIFIDGQSIHTVPLKVNLVR